MKKLRHRLNPNTVVLLKHIGVGVVMVGVVGLLVTGVWYGTRLPSLTISEVEVIGGETINTSSIVRIAESALDGEYIGLIPHRFAWMYPEDRIRTEVASIDRVHNVQLWRAGKTLQVTFDEYVPDALWCDTDQTNDCLFIDETAYAFSNAPQLDGGSLTRFVTTGRTAAVGETMIDMSIYHTTLELERLLADRSWFVSHIEIDQVGDAFLKLVAGGELKVATGILPQEIIDNLFVVLAAKEFSHLQPGNFEYIDLRFGNKVFVKEKETTPEGVDEATELLL